MDVLVLGGGIIGLSTAYYLNAAGHDVTVIERNQGVAKEASYANGGQLSYSYVAPLAGPGVLSKIPKWLVYRNSPMRFRPSLSLDQWRWCFQFVRACTRSQSDKSTQQLLALSFLSRSLMHRLIEEEPTLSFDYAQSGKLIVHLDAGAFQSAVDLLDFQRTLGCEQTALDRDACVALEPALDGVRRKIVGGIYTSSEDTADCYRFCKGLEHILRSRGVQFRLGKAVDALERLANGRIGVRYDKELIDAEQIVLALGAGSAHLLKNIGIRLPVYPLKGYSLTVPTTATSVVPRISITDFSRKIVYAKIGGSMRVAGMADLVGYSNDLNGNRLKTLRQESAAVFPYAGNYAAAGEWSGLRPATPKGTPILGPTSFKNLWLNTGHGALGFTLATGSAQLLSDWISGKPGAIAPSMFGLCS